MIIQSPLGPKMEKDLSPMMAAGADEFYLGYATRLPGAKEFQTRRYSFQANYPTLQTTEEPIKKITEAGKKVFVVFNEHFYSEEFMSQIIKDTKVLIHYGISGLILGDLNLFLRLKQKFPDLMIIGSISTHVMNSLAAQHFFKMGFNRLVLDRHLTLKEINNILKTNPDQEFELIVKNENCPNIDGLCTYVHGDIGGQHFGQGVCGKKESNFIPAYDHFDCAACGLYDLQNFDSLTLKIAGRDKPTTLILQDIAFFKQSANKLKKSISQQNYQQSCISDFKHQYGKSCEQKCYYEVEGV